MLNFSVILVIALVAVVKLIILSSNTDDNNKFLNTVFWILFNVTIVLRLIILMVMLYFP